MVIRRKATGFPPISRCLFGDIPTSFRRNSDFHSISGGFECDFTPFLYRESVKIPTSFCHNISTSTHNAYRSLSLCTGILTRNFLVHSGRDAGGTPEDICKRRLRLKAQAFTDDFNGVVAIFRNIGQTLTCQVHTIAVDEGIETGAVHLVYDLRDIFCIGNHQHSQGIDGEVGILLSAHIHSKGRYRHACGRR